MPEQLADYLGLTIETIRRQLPQMKDDGVLAFDKGGRDCRVLSQRRLAALAAVTGCA